MKLILSFTSICLILLSCSVGKIGKISSVNVPLKGSNYVYENDTVRISYNFWAEKGIMKFDIYNKIDVPLYIDWKNSAYIPNDQMVSYWQDATNTVGASSSANSWLYGGIVTRGVSKSVRQERIAVIPPHSLISRSDYKLVQNPSDMSKVGTFTKESSFLNFRNYLMFATNEKFEGKPSVVDNTFYVQDVKSIKYKNAQSYKANNSFYIKSDRFDGAQPARR